MLLMQRKKPNPTPPTNRRSTSLSDQEILQHSKHDLVECYSDNGYPSLPRPKVILSLRHSDAGTWSHRQASLLQTVPVRILNSTDRELPKERARSLSLDTATTGESQLITHTLPRSPKAPDKKSQQSKNLLPKVKVARSKSLSHAKTTSSLKPVCSSPLLTDCRGPSQTPPGQQSPTQDMSSNHSRVLSRRTAAEATKASGGQNKSKKPRKLGRAITFAFGAGSDKKRRSLGFLGAKDRDVSEDSGSDLGVPSSPILMGTRRSRITGSSSVHDFQRRIPEERDGFESSGDWESVAVHPHHEGGSLVKNHFGSCRDFLSIDESEEVRHQPRVPLQIPVRLETESPDYSPTPSGLSSRQDSCESLTLSTLSEPVVRRSVSSPPSRSHSPNVWRSNSQRTSRERKLSDPAPSSPELEVARELSSPKPSSPRASTLKKRNTFCVRQSKQTQKPGWVRQRVSSITNEIVSGVHSLRVFFDLFSKPLSFFMLTHTLHSDTHTHTHTQHEMRHHVVRFLLETEQSYVQSLQSVIKVKAKSIFLALGTSLPFILTSSSPYKYTHTHTHTLRCTWNHSIALRPLPSLSPT